VGTALSADWMRPSRGDTFSLLHFGCQSGPLIPPDQVWPFCKPSHNAE